METKQIIKKTEALIDELLPMLMNGQVIVE
jgi:hypothetical protein